MAIADKNTNKYVNISTPRGPWERGLTNNSTKGSYTAIDATTTEPVTVDSTTPTSNVLVIPCVGNYTEFAFFGTDGDAETFKCLFSLWSPVNAATPLWHGRIVADITATLETGLPGVSGAVVTDTEYYADIVAQTAGTFKDALSVPDTNVNSPGGTTAGLGFGTVTIDTLGYQKIKVDFDLLTAASANVMYRQF